MAKIYGINGVITGKLGAAVYAVRNGEQISRQYQPVVANPSTQNQVAARAKLKLMSQLAMVLAKDIAMPRVGPLTPRNRFVKENYKLATFGDGQADITLTSVQLTKSNIGLPAIDANHTQGAISAYMVTNPSEIDKVVYVAVEKSADSKLRILGSQVIDEAGSITNMYYPATLPSSANEVVIYAYGVRLNSDAARAVFGNLQATSAETVAKLIVSRSLTESDISLTETVAHTLAAPQP